MNYIILFLLFSQAKSGEASGVPGAFADIGYGTRPMGMGGAFIAVADDGNAAIWNPAALPYLGYREFIFMHANQLGLVPYNYFTYGQSINSKNGLGGVFISSGDDLLRESTIYLSYGREIKDKISIGQNLKLRHASFGNNPEAGVTGVAYGMALDCGVLFSPSKKTKIGILFKEIIGYLSWNSSISGWYKENVPPELIVGGSWKVTKGKFSTNIAADFNKTLYSGDSQDKISVGTEVMIFEILMLRIGMSQNIEKEPINRKFATGVGVNIKHLQNIILRLDYAYLFSELAGTHRIGLRIAIK
jgi:hypothetical protein